MGKEKKHKSKPLEHDQDSDLHPTTLETAKASTPNLPPKQQQQQQQPQSKPQSQPQPNQDFESYYLQRVTAEFADDIDKIRTASDFRSSSIPILVRALKQGAAVGFSEEEKRQVLS